MRAGVLLTWCVIGLVAWPASAQRLFIKSYGQSDGLPAAQVFVGYQDSRSYLWFGTAAGLARYNGHQFQVYSVDDGLLQDSVRAIVEHRGALYLTGEKGVTRQEPGGGFTRFTAADGLGEGIIWRVVVHRDRPWFGSSSGGLSRLDPGDRFTTFTTRDGLPSNNVFALLPDGERLWVGTRGGGLALMEPREGQPGKGGYSVRVIGPADGLGAKQVMALARVGQTLWVGTRDGGIFSRAPGGPFVQRLADASVYSVGRLGDELFWGTLGQGVVRTGPGGQVLRYGTDNGLAGDRVYSVLVDREESIWFTTNSGVSKLLSDKFVSYLSGSNVLSVEEHGGSVWLGTLGQGLMRLQGRQAQPVHQEQLGKQIFEYAGLSFKDEENVAYSYKLEGYDQRWSTPGPERSVRYTNLPPGRHSFRVRARNADGYWSRGPARLAFVVLPPFWRTWWFIGLCALGLALAVYLGVRLRLRKIRRDYLRLEHLVQERTRQLHEAAERLKDLSLTDPLTGLRNRRFLREMVGTEVARVRRLHHNLARELDGARDKAYLGFVLIDVDHFKEVNDTFGHEAGDAMICSYAERLRQALRGEDAVIRWGGEEFLVVCHEVNPDSLHQLCLRVAEQIRLEPFDLPGGNQMRRTCTLGFSTYPFTAAAPEQFNYETVINFADHAMYVGKRNGRDLVVGIVAGDEPIPEADRDRIKRDLAFGVEQGYLRLLSSQERQLEL